MRFGQLTASQLRSAHFVQPEVRSAAAVATTRSTQRTSLLQVIHRPAPHKTKTARRQQRPRHTWRVSGDGKSARRGASGWGVRTITTTTATRRSGVRAAAIVPRDVVHRHERYRSACIPFCFSSEANHWLHSAVRMQRACNCPVEQRDGVVLPFQYEPSP